MTKSPRFFCENCGVEVDRDTKTCPQCGRFFASVRCPACGFTGAEGLFASGCPVCGYSSPGPGAQAPSAGKKPFSRKAPRITAGPLPLWVYILTLFFLCSVASLLFLLIRG